MNVAATDILRKQWPRLVAALIAIGAGAGLTYMFMTALIGRKSAMVTEAESVKTRACAELSPTLSSEVLGRFPVPAPDFEVEDASGKRVRLSNYRGKVIFLNFWAPWCGPCIEEGPALNDLAEQTAGDPEFRDFEMLAVAHEESWDKIREFFPQGTKMTVVRDPSGAPGAIGKRYGTTKIPDTYIIDRQGRIRFWFVNVRKWNQPVALNCIRSMLDDEAPRDDTVRNREEWEKR